MDITSQKSPKGSKSRTKIPTPRCLAISEAGIETANQFAQLMSAIISDVIAGRLDPMIANTSISAGGKMLKVVEMTYKYGGQDPHGTNKVLRLLD